MSTEPSIQLVTSRISYGGNEEDEYFSCSDSIGISIQQNIKTTPKKSILLSSKNVNINCNNCYVDSVKFINKNGKYRKEKKQFSKTPVPQNESCLDYTSLCVESDDLYDDDSEDGCDCDDDSSSTESTVINDIPSQKSSCAFSQFKLNPKHMLEVKRKIALSTTNPKQPISSGDSRISKTTVPRTSNITFA